MFFSTVIAANWSERAASVIERRACRRRQKFTGGRHSNQLYDQGTTFSLQLQIIVY